MSTISGRQQQEVGCRALADWAWGASWRLTAHKNAPLKSAGLPGQVGATSGCLEVKRRQPHTHTHTPACVCVTTNLDLIWIITSNLPAFQGVELEDGKILFFFFKW